MLNSTLNIFGLLIFAAKMNILFVANRVPYPPYRGDKLKIWNLARQLSGKHKLVLISIAQDKEELHYKKQLHEVFDEVHIIRLPKWLSVLNSLLGLIGKLPIQVAYFRSAKFSKLLSRVISGNSFDAIHVQHIRMGYYFRNLDRTNVVLDLPDAFSLYWKRRLEQAKSPLKRWFTGMEYQRLLKFEQQWLPRFPLNLVCSAEDMAYLAENTGANLAVLPNGVDTAQFCQRTDVVKEPLSILFTGNMDYEPNIDAVTYFCEELFPEIKAAVPGAKFVIAGQRPVAKVLKLASEDVIITGFVKDIAAEYAKATVMVAPLRFGAGTQNKVLEALAVGTPVVCSHVGFKGLGLENGQGAILATEKADFIGAVIRILTDEGYRDNLSGSGSAFIHRHYGWDAVAEQLTTYLNQVKRV